MGGSIPIEPLPHLHREGDPGFRLPDGVFIHSQIFHPEENPSRILVVYHHGDGGAFESNIHIRDRFLENGFSVFMFDARCHGRSGGGSRMNRCHLRRGVTQFAEDLLFILQNRIPYDMFDHVFLMGNSLGTAIISYLEMSLRVKSHGSVDGIRAINEKIRGAVFVGLCMMFPPQGCPCMRSAAFLCPIATLMPCIRDPAVMDVDMMLRPDAPEEFRAQMMDPDPTGLLRGDAYTAFYGHAVIWTTEYLQAHLADFRMPIFLMHGEDDRVTDVNGSLTFFDECATPMEKKEVRTYPGFRHLLIMEKCWVQIVDDAAVWIRKIAAMTLEGPVVTVDHSGGYEGPDSHEVVVVSMSGSNGDEDEGFDDSSTAKRS